MSFFEIVRHTFFPGYRKLKSDCQKAVSEAAFYKQEAIWLNLSLAASRAELEELKSKWKTFGISLADSGEIRANYKLLVAERDHWKKLAEERIPVEEHEKVRGMVSQEKHQVAQAVERWSKPTWEDKVIETEGKEVHERPLLAAVPI